MPAYHFDRLWDAFRTLTPARRADIFEAIIEQTYRLHLKPGDVAIDIGAHRARHTIPMAQIVGYEGRVYAIEAAPEMRQKLRAAINHSGVKQIRNIVTYLDCAVSDRDGEMDFYYVPAAAGLSGLKRQNYPEGADVRVEKVEVRRLDDLIPEADLVRFIKIDIEGAEFHALQGGAQTIARGRPMMALEFTGPSAAERYGYSSQEYFAFWKSAGYELYDILGSFYEPDRWGRAGPNYLIACPQEQAGQIGYHFSTAISLAFLALENDAVKP